MSGYKILIVDDEKAVLQNLRMLLEDEGFEVVTAKSGEEAIEILKNKAFDVGIIDIRLPGINGNILIQRAHEIQPGMKYIIHTGTADYIVSASLKNIGITQEDVYIKPVRDMSLFVGAIRRIMNDKSGEKM